MQAWLGRLTLGISPASLMSAYFDWLVHLAISPGKQGELMEKAVREAMQFNLHVFRNAFDFAAEPYISPPSQDHRFQSAEWQSWPFNFLCSPFLLIEQWWYGATTGIQGVSRHHEDVVSFLARQLLDIFSPSNFPLTNPEIMRATAKQGGSTWSVVRRTLSKTGKGRSPARSRQARKPSPWAKTWLPPLGKSFSVTDSSNSSSMRQRLRRSLQSLFLSYQPGL